MLEQARDVMIVISSVLVIVAAITFTVLAIIVFRKLSSALDVAQSFFSDLQSVSSFVSGRVWKPITKGAVFAAGVRKAAATLSGGTRRKEKKDGDRK